MASGHYPKGDNPASGHVSYSQREKRARKKLGFKAYDRAQIQALFAPEALAKLSESARWASLIGLYTGAKSLRSRPASNQGCVRGGRNPVHSNL